MERLSNEVEQFLQSLNNTDHEGDADQNDTEEVIDVYFVPREKIAPQSDIVDAAPAPVQRRHRRHRTQDSQGRSGTAED